MMSYGLSRRMTVPNIWHAVLAGVLRGIRAGELAITMPDGRVHRFTGAAPGPSAAITVNDPAIARRILAGGDVALAEGYMDGAWDADDLAAVLDLGLVNISAGWIADVPFALRPIHRLWHAMRDNDPAGGARRNISHHYDLGNDFYELWLDDTMTYSCALLDGDSAPQTEEQLKSAQLRKWDRILDLVQPGRFAFRPRARGHRARQVAVPRHGAPGEPEVPVHAPAQRRDAPFARRRRGHHAEPRGAPQVLSQPGDAVELLRAARGEAEAGDDLVEEEERLLAVGDRPQPLEEARLRRDDAHVRGDRLDDEDGDLPGVLPEERLDGREVVVLCGQRRLRHPRSRRGFLRRRRSRQRPLRDDEWRCARCEILQVDGQVLVDEGCAQGHGLGVGVQIGTRSADAERRRGG